jgi:ubiquinone/menaquinone biosynthesis C-methylase UbiE
MAAELVFKGEAAAEYDRAFAHVTAHFMPFLLRAAHVAPGMHVLDIATGTGLSAEAALAAVGAGGHVVAADVSPAMAEKARGRLGKRRMLQSLSRMGRRFRSRIPVSMPCCAISG